MNFVDLDASQWKTPLDFYEALLAALGAPRWHGRNINALIDSMVYGGICELEPPLIVRVTGTGNLPDDVRDDLIFTILALGEARTEKGDEAAVEFQGTI
ncbi:MAG TPA: barstar family protein [Rhizomicrobium sp.]|nr:barstar family protein [Rhizomicrobium sp.]